MNMMKQSVWIAQLVEHRALGHGVLGSNLASASYSESDIGRSLKRYPHYSKVLNWDWQKLGGWTSGASMDCPSNLITTRLDEFSAGVKVVKHQ